MHKPKEHRKKLAPRSRKMIFVGYEKDSPNYRILYTERKRISVSANVTFDETNKLSNVIQEQNFNEENIYMKLIFEDEK